MASKKRTDWKFKCNDTRWILSNVNLVRLHDVLGGIPISFPLPPLAVLAKSCTMKVVSEAFFFISGKDGLELKVAVDFEGFWTVVWDTKIVEKETWKQNVKLHWKLANKFWLQVFFLLVNKTCMQVVTGKDSSALRSSFEGQMKVFVEKPTKLQFTILSTSAVTAWRNRTKATWKGPLKVVKRQWTFYESWRISTTIEV